MCIFIKSGEDDLIYFIQGGEDDLINGDVWEEDNKTFMRFTKKLEAAGPSDHPFQVRIDRYIDEVARQIVRYTYSELVRNI